MNVSFMHKKNTKMIDISRIDRKIGCTLANRAFARRQPSRQAGNARGPGAANVAGPNIP
jgi:hypothetical protein